MALCAVGGGQWYRGGHGGDHQQRRRPELRAPGSPKPVPSSRTADGAMFSATFFAGSPFGSDHACASRVRRRGRTMDCGVGGTRRTIRWQRPSPTQGPRSRASSIRCSVTRVPATTFSAVVADSETTCTLASAAVVLRKCTAGEFRTAGRRGPESLREWRPVAATASEGNACEDRSPEDRLPSGLRIGEDPLRCPRRQ